MFTFLFSVTNLLSKPSDHIIIMANNSIPDFTQAASYINQAAAEFSQQFRLLNTTPAAQLQQITTQLQQIQQQMNEQFQHLNQRITAIDTKLDALYVFLSNIIIDFHLYRTGIRIPSRDSKTATQNPHPTT